jgi:hypothetical protein
MQNSYIGSTLAINALPLIQRTTVFLRDLVDFRIFYFFAFPVKQFKVTLKD